MVGLKVLYSAGNGGFFYYKSILRHIGGTDLVLKSDEIRGEILYNMFVG